MTVSSPTTRIESLESSTRPFVRLLELEVADNGDWPQLHCRLDVSHLSEAAESLAEAIARRRIGVNPDLHELWHSHRLGIATKPVTGSALQILEAGLLQNIGTPSQPSSFEHLHGLIAEAIWHEVVPHVDVGLGHPLRVEGHDWSVTDPGGDGLTIYRTTDGYCFRLWESKYHGTEAPVRNTVNAACNQVKAQSLSYLTRFSLIAQTLNDDQALASFYGQLAELWVNHDPSAGVGISVGAGDGVDSKQCFNKVTTYFNLEPLQHQAQLHLIGDFVTLAETVRSEIWKGCGLWTEP